MNKNALILVMPEEICQAIEDEMIRLKRNISNEEVQELLWKLVEQKKAKFLGTTSQDADMICGNMRENGIKVKNIAEEKRQEKL
jgi:hypothetical protein